MLLPNKWEALRLRPARVFQQIVLENKQDLAVLWRKEQAGGRQQTRPACANAEDCPAAFLKGATVTGAMRIKVGWGWVMKEGLRKCR